MNNLTFPFIRKEGIYFVIGAKDNQHNQILLSKREIQILKIKLNKLDVDKMFWKEVI